MLRSAPVEVLKGNRTGGDRGAGPDALEIVAAPAEIDGTLLDAAGKVDRVQRSPTVAAERRAGAEVDGGVAAAVGDDVAD